MLLFLKEKIQGKTLEQAMNSEGEGMMENLKPSNI